MRPTASRYLLNTHTEHCTLSLKHIAVSRPGSAECKEHSVFTQPADSRRDFISRQLPNH